MADTCTTNQHFAEHFGINLEQWIGKTDDEVRPGPAATATRERDQAAKESMGSTEIIAEAATVSGEMRTFRSMRFPITGSNGAKMLAGLAIDITAERQREKALSDANLQVMKLTSHDSLTGVANRREFERRLEVKFALANRQKRPLSVLLMDIDKFKQLVMRRKAKRLAIGLPPLVIAVHRHDAAVLVEWTFPERVLGKPFGASVGGTSFRIDLWRPEAYETPAHGHQLALQGIAFLAKNWLRRGRRNVVRSDVGERVSRRAGA